jgi:hypothetical protein
MLHGLLFLRQARLHLGQDTGSAIERTDLASALACLWTASVHADGWPSELRREAAPIYGAMFRAGSPEQAANSVSQEDAGKLAAMIRALVASAEKAQPDGSPTC